MVTTGPGRISTTSPTMPKSASLARSFSAVMRKASLSSAVRSFLSHSSTSSGGSVKLLRPPTNSNCSCPSSSGGRLGRRLGLHDERHARQRGRRGRDDGGGRGRSRGSGRSRGRGQARRGGARARRLRGARRAAAGTGGAELRGRGDDVRRLALALARRLGRRRVGGRGGASGRGREEGGPGRIRARRRTLLGAAAAAATAAASSAGFSFCLARELAPRWPPSRPSWRPGAAPSPARGPGARPPRPWPPPRRPRPRRHRARPPPAPPRPPRAGRGTPPPPASPSRPLLALLVAPPSAASRRPRRPPGTRWPSTHSPAHASAHSLRKVNWVPTISAATAHRGHQDDGAHGGEEARRAGRRAPGPSRRRAGGPSPGLPANTSWASTAPLSVSSASATHLRPAAPLAVAHEDDHGGVEAASGERRRRTCRAGRAGASAMRWPTGPTAFRKPGPTRSCASKVATDSSARSEAASRKTPTSARRPVPRRLQLLLRRAPCGAWRCPAGRGPTSLPWPSWPP